MTEKKTSTIVIVSKNNGELIRECCEECFYSDRVDIRYEVCSEYDGIIKNGNAILIDSDCETLDAITKETHSLVGFITDEKTLISMSEAQLDRIDRLWTIAKAGELDKNVLLIFLKKLAGAIKNIVEQNKRVEMTQAGMKILFEQAPVGILIYDENRIIKFTNGLFGELFEKTEPVTEKSIDDWKNAMGLSESFIDPGSSMMIQYNSRDYQYRECDARLQDGKIFGGIALIRDITNEMRYTELLENKIEVTDIKLRKSIDKVTRLSKQTVMALAKTIDAKDKYTNGHSVRVADYSKEIAIRSGLSEDETEAIYYMGLLHDIGKIGVPDVIINKTSRLTDEEFERIKEHPSIGFDILSNMADLPDIAVGAKYHHERYNGTGYPEGLKGEKIPVMARIIGVADAFDAMNSNRSYRNGLRKDVILEELEKNKGIQFDPKYAQIMIDMINDGIVNVQF